MRGKDPYFTKFGTLPQHISKLDAWQSPSYVRLARRLANALGICVDYIAPSGEYD